MRNPILRLVLSALAGAALALALLAVLDLLDRDAGFAGSTAASTFGWVLPIMLGAIGVALARSLIQGRRVDSEAFAGHSCNCAACGGSVLVDWRLCPHCGEPLSTEESKAFCS